MPSERLAITGSMLLLLLAPQLASAARVKELTQVQGVRENELFGYGLVVGLSGTGDSERVFFTQQSVSGMLGRMGVRVDPREVRVRNVAAVMVTARLPPFARPGTRLDVTVSSLGNARSLAGGVLVVTPLMGPDGQVWALAQGPVQVGGYEVNALGNTARKNLPNTGRVPQGASIERALTPALQGPLVLQLEHPDFTNASRIASAIEAALGQGSAKALDPAAVQVTIPEGKDVVAALSQVELLDVDIERGARVVVSERTGTIVAGENVRIRAAAVTHGALSVAIRENPLVSQPGAFSTGTTIATQQARVDVAEGGSSVVALPAASSVQELARALNLLGATPRDLVEILQALRAAGALDAEIEVM